MEKTTKIKTMEVAEILRNIANTTTGYEVTIQQCIDDVKAILYSTIAFSGMEGYGITESARKEIVDNLDEAMERVVLAIDLVRSNNGTARRN